MRIAPASLLLDVSRDFADHRARRDSGWYGHLNGKTWGAIPFYVSNLYRGQNARHLPMLPSISRGLTSPDAGELWRYSIADQAKIVIRLAQSWWFSCELDNHPISTHATKQGLGLDRIALAQHYGIPTGYLDLTDDFNVGAFFATCRETEDRWEPVKEGVGVMYRVDLRGPHSPISQYIPLGPQPLPRPTEQCAWVTELPFCHSFEGGQNVFMMQFHHDRHIGAHFLEMFAGGEALFPPDPLADVATEILACRELPADLVERALESFAEDPHGIQVKDISAIRGEISKQATLTDYRRLLTDSQVSGLLADFEWRKRMLPDVKVNWRAVRRVPVKVDEENDL